MHAIEGWILCSYWMQLVECSGRLGGEGQSLLVRSPPRIRVDVDGCMQAVVSLLWCEEYAPRAAARQPTCPGPPGGLVTRRSVLNCDVQCRRCTVRTIGTVLVTPTVTTPVRSKHGSFLVAGKAQGEVRASAR